MELIALTPKEVHRLEVLTPLEDRTLTQAEAASKLSLSARQVRRLLRGYRRNGAASLPSQKRGRPPNNALDPELIARIVEYCRGPYAGFGPTFAAEKLRERNDIAINKETLRQLLMRHRLWKGKRRKLVRHLPRDRREQFGELQPILTATSPTRRKDTRLRRTTPGDNLKTAWPTASADISELLVADISGLR